MGGFLALLVTQEEVCFVCIHTYTHTNSLDHKQKKNYFKVIDEKHILHHYMILNRWLICKIYKESSFG